MPPSEEAKVTDALFGTTFSVAAQIKGLDGEEVILYVFSVGGPVISCPHLVRINTPGSIGANRRIVRDLPLRCVSSEEFFFFGRFILRYRMFDIFR